VIALVTWEPVRRRLIYLALGREQLHVDPPTGVSPEVALREALRAYRDQGESLIGNGDPEMYARWARGVADFLTDEYGHERSALFIGEEGFGESGMASRLERLDELIREQEAQCLVDEVRSGRSSSHEG
jgi:4-aminobutyrate aminotransferase-like enzyme